MGRIIQGDFVKRARKFKEVKDLFYELTDTTAKQVLDNVEELFNLYQIACTRTTSSDRVDYFSIYGLFQKDYTRKTYYRSKGMLTLDIDLRYIDNAYHKTSEEGQDYLSMRTRLVFGGDKIIWKHRSQLVRKVIKSLESNGLRITDDEIIMPNTERLYISEYPHYNGYHRIQISSILS